MIRSEVPRLVDAGEPVGCLLVFQTLLKGKGEASLLKSSVCPAILLGCLWVGPSVTADAAAEQAAWI